MISGIQESPPDGMLRRAARIQACLETLLPPEESRSRLDHAMAWSLLAGGKRLRPVLALTTAGMFGAEEEILVKPACALECLHTYSLVHDDLPPMDDDSLRRGRATCHVRFGEATAILAGDALQTLAFELIAENPEGDAWAGRKVEVARILAKAAGREGMVLGQELDLAATGAGKVEARMVRRIHQTKTAALLSAAVRIGGVYAGASEGDADALRRFGEALGEAFQVVDDVLDEFGDRERLGKETGVDRKANKATAVAAWGEEGARRRAEDLAAEADAALVELSEGGLETGELHELMRFVLRREH